jgi:transposase
MASRESLFIGIDVSKQTLDVAFGADPHAPLETIPYTDEGVQLLVTRLQRLQPTLIVLEATGGLERMVFAQLLQAGLPTARVQPRRVRALAHAEGRQAKTDRLDARLLARFAERVRPPHHQATDEQRASLRDLLVRREQLIQMRTAEINRLTAAAPNLRPGIQKHIDWLDQEIRALEQELDNEAERTDEVRRKRELLESVPGIGAITALNLLLRLPELGTINRKEAAAFVGVAPYANQSGAQRKPRHISGGRRDVRSVLYMATLAATRRRLVRRAFYQRLCQAGKPRKVAIVAAMRKLLTILGAILRQQKPWDPAVHTSAP